MVVRCEMEGLVRSVVRMEEPTRPVAPRRTAVVDIVLRELLGG